MWIDFVAMHASHHPNRLAVIDETTQKRICYAELDNRASRWASWFHKNGAAPGDRIALLACNRLEHLTMFLGATRIGALFAPLNFRLSAGELEELLTRIEPLFLFTHGQWDLGNDANPIALETFELPDHVAFRPIEPAPNQPMLLLFTSGSSGIPKGVILHAKMLWSNMVHTHAGWGLRPDDVSVVHTPFFHTGGYNVTCLPLLRLGGSLILTGPFEPEKLLNTLEREKVTVFFAVPTMFQAMAESELFSRVDLSRLRFCISGGAPCPRMLIDRYRDRGIVLRQGFGLTEVGPNCFYMFEEDIERKPDSVGLPILGARARLVDEQGRDVPDGETGELCLAGPHVCSGYWRMTEAFNRVYRDGYFHTGDLMRRDAEGFYYVVGRIKDMYISGGENVYPGEVVRQILQHPEVLQAEVIPVKDQKWGEVGYAFIRSATELGLDELRQFLNPRLSRYKHPRHLRCATSFPLLPNGKIDFRALARIAEDDLHES